MYTDRRDHVFTLYPYHNLVVQESKGCVLRDERGREYVDLASGQLCTILGHGHARLIEAARRQMEKGVNLGNRFFATATLDACSTLAAVCQEGLDKVVLCSTGAEANEIAIRMARAATGHHELVGIRKGYHGATHQTLSLSEYVGLMKGVGIPSPGINRLICPECDHCPLGLERPTCEIACLDASAMELTTYSTGAIAAFLAEPVLGAGGIIVPPADYFQRLRKLCDKYGALLIADEAQTGLGRTGRWMGMEHHGVVPDICVLSKGLGGGFPVAAVVTTEAIENKCLSAPMANMSSHSFDPLGSAVVTELIQIIREEGLVQRAEELGRYLEERLRGLAERSPLLGKVRGLGLMRGIEVVSPRTGAVDSMFSLALESECLLQGVVVGYADRGVLRLLPALTITQEELDRGLDALGRATRYLEAKGIDPFRYMPTHRGSMKLAASFIGPLTTH